MLTDPEVTELKMRDRFQIVAQRKSTSHATSGAVPKLIATPTKGRPPNVRGKKP